ncbi:MAG: MerR family transcriptional regulator [Candidatus Kapabacteria bacterium]|nr:MerR family transcriptional regulator [Ignavibacteriota bacterium]MCW5886125.1 MerR family transcriptional regulator [Candidatus Kapabacteria bacterium]
MNQFDKDKPVFSISSAARMLDISVHTIRMYEREGLIISYKPDNRNRLYSENDIQRLRCLRQKIQEKKFSINAIQAIFSLVPCWSMVNCSENDRSNCLAFQQAEQPCWMFKHTNNICEKMDCYECDVYRKINCIDIKNSIKKLSVVQ